MKSYLNSDLQNKIIKTANSKFNENWNADNLIINQQYVRLNILRLIIKYNDTMYLATLNLDHPDNSLDLIKIRSPYHSYQPDYQKGFLKLIHLICSKQCNEIVVNYQDRLARFGFDLIQTICEENQVKLTVINQTQTEDPNQELVDDVLSIITVFYAKLYGKRSHKNEKVIKANKELFS